MLDPTGPLWRVVDPSGIRIRRFGDEALVFNPLTWETHLLNGVALRVLEAFSAGPKAEALLLDGLCGAEPGAPESMRDTIREFLRELETLGLIETVREGNGEDRGSR